MTVRKATIQETDEIFTFVKAAVERMEEQGIPQWDELYPTQEDFIQDAKSNQLYIAIVDEKPAACFTLNKNCDEEYKNGSWDYTGDDYCVIHRLCVNPEFQNRGLGTEICNEIEKLARQGGAKSIKLDCFTQNPYSLRMYKKLGYSQVGFADWRKGRFVLMEKIL